MATTEDWALHGTFRGGKEEPGHLWYPYLEGFSPEFVRQVYKLFMPEARRVLDPFAGTGTVPFTLATIGVKGAFCEINPVLRRVIDLKLKVLGLDASSRERFGAELAELAGAVAGLVDCSNPDTPLAAAYRTAFGDSEFFTRETKHAVIRLRSVVDHVASTNSLLGHAIEVAVLSQLVPCSLMKRAGDLRYMTDKEKARGLPNLLDSLRHQLINPDPAVGV